MSRKGVQGALKLTKCPTARSYHSSAPWSVAKLLESPGSTEQRQVFGFIRSVRKQKHRAFASIGDGSSLEPLQAVLTPAQAEHLATGTAVSFVGQWTDSPQGKSQAREMHVSSLSILGNSDPATFPLQKKFQTAEYLRTMPHLRGRLPFNSALLRLRSQSIAQITRFFARKDFVQTHPPIITSSDCEGAGEVFSVTTDAAANTVSAETDRSAGEQGFFRGPKYLTVSSQLHLEALAQSVGNVWTLSPTFRAERSDTSRHLSEFYMLEAELNFTDDMERVMTLVEDMLCDLTHGLYGSQVGQEIISGNRPSEDKEVALTAEDINLRWTGMMSYSWPRITYTEAIEILQESAMTFEHPPSWGNGLQAEHERYIADGVGQGRPVFVTHYPQSMKAFYMLPSKETTAQGPTVDCFDLLVPSTCEIAGGSMREHRLTALLATMRARGMISASDALEDLDPALSASRGGLDWYVDLRRWGSAPHGGFGLGFDRLLCYLAGVPSIREVVGFPRWAGRCDC